MYSEVAASGSVNAGPHLDDHMSFHLSPVGNPQFCDVIYINYRKSTMYCARVFWICLLSVAFS
jgi:hypothetical protein